MSVLMSCTERWTFTTKSLKLSPGRVGNEIYKMLSTEGKGEKKMNDVDLSYIRVKLSNQQSNFLFHLKRLQLFTESFDGFILYQLEMQEKTGSWRKRGQEEEMKGEW